MIGIKIITKHRDLPIALSNNTCGFRAQCDDLPVPPGRLLHCTAAQGHEGHHVVHNGFRKVRGVLDIETGRYRYVITC